MIFVSSHDGFGVGNPVSCSILPSRWSRAFVVLEIRFCCIRNFIFQVKLLKMFYGSITLPLKPETFL
jgi:hypothetical protein